jgi:hypothetical protein
MKTTLPYLLAAVALASCSSGRFNDESGEHARMVSESRAERSTIVSMDTVFKAGMPYAVIKSTGGMLTPVHTFYTLNGREVIDVVQSASKKNTTKTFQEYKVLDPGVAGSAFIEFSMSTMTVVDYIVDNDLISSTGVNTNAANTFILKYRDPDIQPKAPEVNRMVDRNRTAEVFDVMTEKKIKQGGKIIGSYKETGDMVGDERYATKTVYFTDGTVCATVTYKYFSPFDAEIVTSKDNKSHNVSREGVNRDIFEVALKYLVDKLYL